MTENWQNPLNQLRFKKAFQAQAKTVTIRDGRRFSIEYEMRKPKSVVNELSNAEQLFAYVKPIKERQKDSRYAPCGWFNVDSYLKGN